MVVEELVHLRFNDRLTFDRKLSELDDNFTGLQCSKKVSFEDLNVEPETS